jgi:hypothetical protein
LDDESGDNPAQVLAEQVCRRDGASDHRLNDYGPATAITIGDPAPERNDTNDVRQQDRRCNGRSGKLEFRL